ncbi:MAG: hypothetical protein Q8O67_05435 [Deltaproteobacteria bacterium]|nr:hypothetical protein [Deltaproteobacteria bacterium]
MPSGGPLTWHVDVDDAFLLKETICPAVEVFPEDRRARDFLVSSRIVDGCRQLVFDLGRAANALQDRDSATRVAVDVVVSSPDVWLWHPRPARSGTLTVKLPPGFSAVLPFPAGEAEGSYDVDGSTWAFVSNAVFGKVPAHEIVVGGSILHVVMLPGEPKMVRSEVDRWLTAAAEAVASANHGRFPFARVVVLVDPVWGSGVPFGMVSRGGGPQALLLLGEKASVGDVVDDWVAVHELSHLLMPPVGLDESWLGEGLASYFQNILRARTGLMSEREAWEELREGFERGAAAASRGPFTVSLREASAQMHSSGRYLQVYWGGAAIVLLLDVGLRQCAGVGVDDVVASFRAEQPRVDVRRVPAREVVARAAGMAPGCKHLQADVDAMLARPFPAIDALLDDLGVAPGHLSEKAPRSSLRRAISKAAR